MFRLIMSILSKQTAKYRQKFIIDYIHVANVITMRLTFSILLIMQSMYIFASSMILLRSILKCSTENTQYRQPLSYLTSRSNFKTQLKHVRRFLVLAFSLNKSMSTIVDVIIYSETVYR